MSLPELAAELMLESFFLSSSAFASFCSETRRTHLTASYPCLGFKNIGAVRLIRAHGLAWLVGLTWEVSLRDLVSPAVPVAQRSYLRADHESTTFPGLTVRYPRQAGRERCVDAI